MEKTTIYQFEENIPIKSQSEIVGLHCYKHESAKICVKVEIKIERYKNK